MWATKDANGVDLIYPCDEGSACWRGEPVYAFDCEDGWSYALVQMLQAWQRNGHGRKQ